MTDPPPVTDPPAPPTTPPPSPPTTPPPSPPTSPPPSSGLSADDIDAKLNAWGERFLSGLKEAFQPPEPPKVDPPKTDPPPADPPKTDPPPADPPPKDDDTPGKWKWDGGKGWFR